LAIHGRRLQAGRQRGVVHEHGIALLGQAIQCLGKWAGTDVELVAGLQRGRLRCERGEREKQGKGEAELASAGIETR
jgi:hypothetical protein